MIYDETKSPSGGGRVLIDPGGSRENQESLYENPYFVLSIPYIFSNCNRIFDFFFQFRSIYRVRESLFYSPCSQPLGHKSHAHIIHGLPGRFYRTVDHSKRCVFCFSGFVFTSSAKTRSS